MYVDETDLYFFNDSSMSSLEVVIEAQQILNAWNESLKFTGGDLKLCKF